MKPQTSFWLTLPNPKLINKLAPELIAALAAASVYCAMYAFRKPFTMLTFEHVNFLGVGYKIWLITAQLLGYALSKTIGIRVISEMKANSRMGILFSLIGVEWFSLFLFAILPPPWTILCMFMNGIPLGLIWGIVFSYLEGRTTTDLLAAILASSFIFSSGFVKSIGGLLLQSGSAPQWMPFMTGALFVLPLIIMMWVLNKINPPDETDLMQRSKRVPMNKLERKKYLKEWSRVLIPLIFIYIFFIILRDYRDSFTAEIFAEIKDAKLWWITQSELYISMIILAVLGGFIFLKNHFKALIWVHILMITGFILVISCTWFFSQGRIPGILWFIIAGMGVFAGYIPFNCILVDRLIALINHPANAGFIMYLLDSCAYAGTILILFFKEWSGLEISPLNFFMNLCYILGWSGILLVTASLLIVFKKLSI